MAFQRIEQLPYSYAPSLLRWEHVKRLKETCKGYGVEGGDVVRFLSTGEAPKGVVPYKMLHLAGMWCVPCVRFGDNLPGGAEQERSGTEQAVQFLKAAAELSSTSRGTTDHQRILCSLIDCYLHLNDTNEALISLTKLLYYPTTPTIKTWVLPPLSRLGIRDSKHLALLEGTATSPSSHYAIDAWKTGGFEVFLKRRGRDGKWRAVGEPLCREFLMHHVLLAEFEDTLIEIREELWAQDETPTAWLGVLTMMFQSLLSGWVMGDPDTPSLPDSPTPFAVAKHTMYNPPTETTLAAIAAQCTGDATVSELVREFVERVGVLRQADVAPTGCDTLLAGFYNEHPYPVWFNIGAEGLPRYDSYLAYLRAYLPRGVAKGLAWNEGAERVLVAGCGSGHQMAIALHQYKQSKVVGVDLSRVNLDYAEYRLKGMFEGGRYELVEKGIEECTPEGMGLFDVVECCGVLHHCESPRDALMSLKKLLKPGGVLLLGVYAASSTEKVRGCITYLRDKYPAFSEYRPPSLVDIRSIRNEVKELSPGNAVRRVLTTQSSFYAAAPFHDMLYHPRAVYYSLQDLRDLVTPAGFSLLSLSFDSCNSDIAARLKYSTLNPTDDAMSSWDTWIKVEQHGIMQSLPWHNLLLRNDA